MLFEIVEEIIEIPEEAYKKNEVYRPWPTDEGTKGTTRFLLAGAARHKTYDARAEEGNKSP